jgi:PGF-CTERM protein/PGF-pre-PGF domain-containing protein
MNQKLTALVIATVMVASMATPASFVGTAAGNTGNTGTLMGAVANSSGGAVDNAQVAIYNEANDVYFDTTDGQGDYKMTGVSESNYTLVAYHSNYAEAIKSDVQVTAGQTTTADLTLEKPQTISGTVTDNEGAGVANLQVLLDNGDRFYGGVTDQNGDFTVRVPPGTYNTMIFSGGQGWVLENSLTLDTSSDTTTGLSLDVVKPTIHSSSITVTSGASGVDTSNLGVDVRVRNGMMNVRATNDKTENMGMPNELSSLGVDKDTTFEITINTENYEPNSLLWAARDVSWSTTKNDDGTTDITVTTKAAHLAGIQQEGLPIGPLMGKNPDEVTWPTGSADAADLGWERTVYFSLFDLSNMPSSARSDMGGMTVTTNAQTFMLPRLDDNELEIWVGGPHKDKSDQVHDGYYEAKIPDSQLEAWGVSTSDPASELQAKFKGSDKSASFTDLDDGVKVEMDLTYSAGSISVSPSGGGGGGGDDGDGPGGGHGGGGGGGGASGQHLSGAQSISEQFFGSSVSEARIDFQRSIEGRVSIKSIRALPSDVPRPDGDVVSSLDISVPDSERDRPATLSLTVSRDAIEAANTDPEKLKIARLRRGANAPEVLDTSVEAVTEDSVELSAETPGFSVFVVVSTDTADTPTATPAAARATPTPPPSTPTATPEPVEDTEAAASTPTQPQETSTPAMTTPSTPTPASSPGFGILAALVGLLATIGVVRRRR